MTRKILLVVCLATGACQEPTDNAAGAPTITTTTLPAGEVGVAYNRNVDALGGTPPITWSISAGALPAGLNIGAATGAVAGTPTAAGSATFTVRAADGANKSSTRAFALSVTPAPTITTPSLPDGDLGTPYSQTLAASGGTPPFTWTVSVGALPAGLNVAASGLISGTPTASGTASFTVMLTDAAGGTATKALSILIAS